MKPATLTIALFVALLCAASVLCTLGASASVKFYSADAPSGERAMGLLVVLLFMLIGWAALLLAAIVCASGGSLSWLATSSALAGVIASAAVLILATAAGACFVAWAEPAASHFPRPVVVSSAILSTTIVPCALALLFMLSAWVPHESFGTRALQMGALALALFSVLGCATGIDIIISGLRHRAANQLAMIAERRATEDKYEALRAMPAHERALLAFKDYSPDSPLWTIAGFLIDDMGDAKPAEDTELHRVVLERAAQLPDLEAQLKSLCSIDDTRLRACGVEFVRVSGNRSDARAECLIAAIDRLASEITATPSMEGYYPGFDLGAETARVARTAALFPQATISAAMGRLRQAVAAAHDTEQKHTAERALGIKPGSAIKAAP
jgi:hypothetical protein